MNIASDISIFADGYTGDGSLANIVYTHRTTTGTLDINVTGALKFNLDTREKDLSYGVYTVNKVSFLVPTASFTTVKPTIGDEITDDASNVWWINGVGNTVFNGGYTCGCTRLDINDNLADIATVYRVMQPLTANEDCDRVTNVAPDQFNIKCRIQPTTANIVDYQNKRIFIKSYVMYAEQFDFEFKFGDIIKTQPETAINARTFKVVSWERAQSITDLEKVFLEMVDT